MDRESVRTLLEGYLTNLHRDGAYLEAACPRCGGSDRFFTGPKFQYRVWHCRQCGYTTTTDLLAGRAPTCSGRPTVLSWQGRDAPSAEKPERIRDLYADLAGFAARHLDAPPAVAYLADRGLTLEQARELGLGYINASLYRTWWNRLTPAQRATCAKAGLPDLSDGRFRTFARMFAAGRKGKILFPYRDGQGRVLDLRTRSVAAHDTVRGRPVRYVSPKGSLRDRGAWIPYGAWLLEDDTGPVLLTEGEFKVLTPVAQGFPLPILGLRGVNDLQPEYIDLLRDRPVILAFDNDARRNSLGLAAGEMATVQVGRYLRAHGVAVAVLPPTALGKEKGIDDFVLAHGADALAALVAPENLRSLDEYEAILTRRGACLDKLPTPRPDPGTVRYWAPPEQVDEVRTQDPATCTVAQAEAELQAALQDHWQNWQPGAPQLMATATAGVGKTTLAVATARAAAEAEGRTVAILLPTHAIIDEKIGDGTLAGFRHIYGRRWDGRPDDPWDATGEGGTGVRNCIQADAAQTLERKGYSPGELLCPTCPAAVICATRGYKSQFQDRSHRAYSHGHLYSDYPGDQDLIILDEFTHRTAVQVRQIRPDDLIKVLRDARVPAPQRRVLDALLELYKLPDIRTVEGRELYLLLERTAPDLRTTVDAWSDGPALDAALDHLVRETLEQGASPLELEQLPDRFGARLIAVLAEDIRRINRDERPTGRLRLVVAAGGNRYLEMTTFRGPLPDWFRTRPVAILNATADPRIMQDILGPLRTVSPRVTPLAGSRIVQDVTYNNAKTGLLGDSPRARARRERWIRQIREHVEDEADTVLVTTKALVPYLEEAFPRARVAWYGNLEGRNDLQAGTLILANPPAVNLPAVLREACALYPGVDTTLVRRAVAFDYTNEAGHYLAVEQVDAADDRVARLLWQHRDALLVQAVQRMRLVRRTGKVVALFARSIPGLAPTEIRHERPPALHEHNTRRKREAREKLLAAGRRLLGTQQGFILSTLTAEAGVARSTAWRHWPEVTRELGLAVAIVPAVQPLANGGRKPVNVAVAVRPEVIRGDDVSQGNEKGGITGANVVPKELLDRVRPDCRERLRILARVLTPLLPAGWEPDLHTLAAIRGWLQPDEGAVAEFMAYIQGVKTVDGATARQILARSRELGVPVEAISGPMDCWWIRLKDGG